LTWVLDVSASVKKLANFSDGLACGVQSFLVRSRLANLRERVRLLGGTLKIETSPGKGTRLAVDIPRKA